MDKIFTTPFALEGDREEIPDGLQVSGNVSFAQGYGFDYERDPATDPLAKDLERKKTNWLFGVLTEGLGHYQTTGVPPFILPAANGGRPWPYVKGAHVLYEGKVYESLGDQNTALPTDAKKWRDTSTMTGYLPDALELKVDLPLTGGGLLKDKLTLKVNGATDSQAGITRYASANETEEGKESKAAVTPFGLAARLAALVPKTRKINTTAPLEGGGALTGDLTLTVAAASETAVGVSRFATAHEARSRKLDNVALTPKTGGLLNMHTINPGALNPTVVAESVAFINPWSGDANREFAIGEGFEYGSQFTLRVCKGLKVKLVTPSGRKMYIDGSVSAVVANGETWVAPASGYLECYYGTSIWYVTATLGLLSTTAEAVAGARSDVAVTPSGVGAHVYTVLDNRGLMDRGAVTKDPDLDTLTAHGLYAVQGTAPIKNAPIANTSNLNVQVFVGSTYTEQWVTSPNALTRYFKRYRSGTGAWQPWIDVNDSFLMGEIRLLHEVAPPAGWRVCDGALVSGADTALPRLWAYLQTSGATWKLRTQAQWAALSTTAGGTGGVGYYVLDTAAKTIRLPDLRGDFFRGASGVLAPVGGWQGDAIRNITGSIVPRATEGGASGAFAATAVSAAGAYGSGTQYNFSFDASRVVPTADENRPRNFSLLACVYVGL